MKTREAEIVQHEIPQTYAAALKAAAELAERAQLAETMYAEAEVRVMELAPRAISGSPHGASRPQPVS